MALGQHGHSKGSTWAAWGSFKQLWVAWGALVLVKLTIFNLILQIRLYKVWDGLGRQRTALGQHGHSKGSTWAALGSFKQLWVALGGFGIHKTDNVKLIFSNLYFFDPIDVKKWFFRPGSCVLIESSWSQNLKIKKSLHWTKNYGPFSFYHIWLNN